MEKIIVQYEAIAKEYDRERKLLARLAAKGPAFTNPLTVYDAERVRDRILREMRMNPDGSFIKKGGA
jgi:hypothetical protein